MLVVGLLGTPIAASGAQGDILLLWADRPDEATDAVARQVEIRGDVVVARLEASSVGGESGVRAYDKDDGRLLWSRPHDAGTGSLPAKQAGMATSQGSVFTVGYAPADNRPGPLNRTITTGAVSLRDGAVRWGQTTVLLGATGLRLNDMVRFGPRLFVVGTLSGRPWVRVQSTRDGSVLWEHYPELDEQTGSESTELAFFSRKRLYTAGIRAPGDGGPTALVHRRFHATRGRLQSEVVVDDGRSIRPLSLLGGIVVGQWSPAPTSTAHWLVLVVDNFAGEVRWDDTAFPSALSAATDVVAFGGNLYVAGWVERRRRQPVLRAYDGSTGELLWQRVGAGVRRGAYLSIEWDFRAEVLVVTGTGRQPGMPGDRALVQTFAADGELLSSRFGPAGAAGGRLVATDRRNRTVFAGGAVTDADGSSLPLLHLYQIDR